MQLRRAVEICNNNDNDNVTLYYYNKPVKLVSVDNNIGTAYVKALNDDSQFEVNLESLHENEKK
ncbi:small acid-soluble spore protein%2C H-type [uncultured Clostridium sp.]|uniref:Small, acid-soluble spore protein, H family n=1 Tax=Paeniclostridium hominis TaxID=2764329 RepID=A0ABR7K214_9FIRM|nr:MULTISPECIES: small, acid-soluble spore protein, H family [Paeniclostridium]MDU1538128.1 small, acid-soluble spore protein, H family [Paeniclostridium sordellii]SCI80729.1 small acid-soluble spore protein%2C H-type [uncultured Clostridium sp.]MBC6003149.1 small, acid-soluble spore protein, H family [Paeniclostridium hominis]MBC8630623.1 small, acid-soluble spore protein, H family [[Eubacterium] tenue]SCI94858.1 small acid-soluble spore protein%2C H-type [uncultured Clostridium sp.]